MSDFLNNEVVKRLSDATDMEIETINDLLIAIKKLLDKCGCHSKFVTHRIFYCESCGKQLPANSKEPICWLCKDQELFEEVKEYIRNNDVREYEIATKFNIPVSHVRKWIREGRIQYKESETTKLSTNCMICGVPILFGTMCTKCLKAQTHSGSQSPLKVSEPGNMWFLNDKWLDKKES